MCVRPTVGHSHASSQRGLVISAAHTNTMRTFVDVQERADTVASAVTEIKAIFPQSMAGKRIQEVA